MPQQKSASAVIKVRGYFLEKNQVKTVTAPPNGKQQYYLGTEGWLPQRDSILMTDSKPQLVFLGIAQLPDRMERKPGYSGPRASSPSRKT